MEQKEIRHDRVDRYFLGVIVSHMILVLLIQFTPFTQVIPWNMATNGILSGATIWIPALIYFAVTRQNPIKFCRFRRIRLGTVFMTLLFTMLCSPLTTLANAVSMLFVDNTVLSISGSVLKLPFVVMFFIIGVSAPFVEEFGMRGVVFQGLRSRGNVWKAILLSAFLFAVMHMNLNQAAYAFVIGIMMALLMEATDSIWPSFIMHMAINGFAVVSMYLLNGTAGGAMEMAAEAALTTQDLLLVISVYLVLAVVCTPLALCVLVWIAGHENRKEALGAVLPGRKSSHFKLVTIPLLLGILICLGMMIIDILQM